jgi:CubicO group peptidase (beta-lactamase class C family)
MRAVARHRSLHRARDPSVAPHASGDVAPGFDPVRAAFEANFRERNDLGAAVAVWLDGKPVVDLWGGYLDKSRTRPWDRDAVVLVFSATKGLAAASLAVASSRGLFDYDERVSRYSPEFADGARSR